MKERCHPIYTYHTVWISTMRSEMQDCSDCKGHGVDDRGMMCKACQGQRHVRVVISEKEES